jgi:hypothetical protein
MEQLTIAQNNAKKVREDALATVKAKAQLRTLSVESIEKQVEIELHEDTSNALEAMLTVCKEVVENNPLPNKEGGGNREFRVGHFYGLGSHLQVLLGMLNGIQYSAAIHKEKMLTELGLTSSLVENTLLMAGTLDYFSETVGEISIGYPLDVNGLEAYLTMIESTLDINLNLNQLNSTVVASRESKATATAKRLELEFINTDSNARFVIT